MKEQEDHQQQDSTINQISQFMKIKKVRKIQMI